MHSSARAKVKARIILPLITLATLVGALLVMISGVQRASIVHATGTSYPQGFYQQTNLVSNIPGMAKFTDAYLRNPWGLAYAPGGPWWVADNSTALSTLYGGDGTPFPPGSPIVVSIPKSGGIPGGAPTGTVFNPFASTNPHDFVISKNGNSGPGTFLFASEDGTISGWNPNVDPRHAIIAADRSTLGPGAVYKGLAIASSGKHAFIYATNFRLGTVEMLNGQFKLVRSFTDHQVANNCPLPGQCFSPFDIQNIGNKLYVTYALQKPDKHDDQKGVGNGFIDVFSTEGQLLRRLAAHGPLNSPWGLAMAPNNFGPYSGDLLVGNFGDGHINAFTPTGRFLGPLKDPTRHPIAISGLWGIAFGNDQLAGASNELYFSAGTNFETDGLFGKISFFQPLAGTAPGIGSNYP